MLTVIASNIHGQALETVNSALNVKVAPGELLHVAVKLSNFGGGSRVDVILTYLVTSLKGEEIFKSTETVAVETTNNFAKNLQIPAETMIQMSAFSHLWHRW